jgi:hypothetical protein
MIEAVRGGRPVPLGARLAAVLAAPLAPLFGLLVAYLVYHPLRPRRRHAPSAFGLIQPTCGSTPSPERRGCTPGTSLATPSGWWCWGTA